MNISFLFLWILILKGRSSAIDNEENCKASKELNDLCGTHTFQSVKPILNYVDQLQKEQLSNNYEAKEKEINDMREKMQQMHLKIVSLETASLSKDTRIEDLQHLKGDKDVHIKDLQATVSVLKQNIELVNSEIAQLKTFIKEELARTVSVIDSNASKLHHCEDQLMKNNRTFAKNTAEIKSKDENLKSCQLSLNETKKVVREYKDQLEIQSKTITENDALLLQVESKEKELKKSLMKLNDSENDLKNQKEIFEEKEKEVLKLKEEIKNEEEKQTSCLTYCNSNDIHNVQIANFETFPVLCNSKIAGAGWIVIQQRINGGEDFYRNWETYKNGFGVFTGDFFLGLEKVHRLTNDKPHELYIYLESFKEGKYNGYTWFARYDNFRIAGENDKYRLLSLGTYSGNSDKNRMRDCLQRPFSTFDTDNDSYDNYNCAKNYKGGWWYHNCYNCNLNGKYFQQETNNNISNNWVAHYSLKTIKMLIRPRIN